jgi:hypothetical protein
MGKPDLPEDQSTVKKSNNNDKNNQAPSLLQVIGSVLSAFIGIQNSKNKERDFKHGNHKVFIIVGIGLTITFLLTVFTVVQLVLSK